MHTMKHALAGQKSKERVLCSRLNIADKHLHIMRAAGCDVGSFHEWTRYVAEAFLQWCKGGEWSSWTPYGNNSLSCICTTLCTVHLLCPSPTSAHDLPFTVAVSAGKLRLYKIKLLLIAKDNKVPHLNMWSGYSSLGTTDTGAGRTEVCREVRVLEENRLRDGQEHASEEQQNLAPGADEFTSTLLQVNLSPV